MRTFVIYRRLCDVPIRAVDGIALGAAKNHAGVVPARYSGVILGQVHCWLISRESLMC